MFPHDPPEGENLRPNYSKLFPRAQRAEGNHRLSFPATEDIYFPLLGSKLNVFLLNKLS